MYKPGDRVGVMISCEEGVCRFLGYGVYEGDFSVDEKAGGFAPIMNGIKNPHIKLDNGDICWGCEIWWGSEEKFKKMLDVFRSDGIEIRNVRISDMRQEVKS